MNKGMIRVAGVVGTGAIAGVLATAGAASAAPVSEQAAFARASAITGTVTADVTPVQKTQGRFSSGSAVGVARSAPTSAAVPIEGQYQQTDYYCVPASSSAGLASIGVHVSQKTLAKKMKTTKRDGTYYDKALRVLNTYAKRKGYTYTWTHPHTAKKLLNAVAYDTGTLKKAAMMPVFWEKLPWNKGLTDEKNLGHMIVLYGYDRSDKTIKVWDPWKETGGRHTISAAKLVKAEQDSSLVYLTKR